ELLYSRAPGRASMDITVAPVIAQPVTVQTVERLGNVRRLTDAADNLYSRFDVTDPGPRVDTDASGLPIFTASSPNQTQTSVTGTVQEQDGNQRTRLILPMLASFYYLPVDPVCDITLGDAATKLAANPATGAIEPIWRPVTLAAFPDLTAVRDENWTLS